MQDIQSPSSHISARPSTTLCSLSLRGVARRWAGAALAALNPFSRVPSVGLACPLEVAPMCEAVIRSDGFGAATAALSLRGPDGTEHVLLFPGSSVEGSPGTGPRTPVSMPSSTSWRFAPLLRR